jgi:small subunit ribosomal protein S9
MNIIQAIGRRKTAVASIWLSEGKGQINVNKRSLTDYFPTQTQVLTVQQPLELLEKGTTSYDITIRVKGGGITGQAEAIRHAIARALCTLDKENRPILKKHNLLQRDPRMVERKKYNQPKARKKFTWVKR